MHSIRRNEVMKLFTSLYQSTCLIGRSISWEQILKKKWLSIVSLHNRCVYTVFTGHDSKLNVWMRTQDDSKWNKTGTLITPTEGDVNATIM